MAQQPDNSTFDLPVLHSIAPFAEQTQAWIVDIWGVMHNGVEPFFGAVTACQRFRDTGGCVLLLSNSPRPREGVIAQLNEIGVPDDAWDAIITSGDVTRELIHMLGETPVYHLGPERDLPVFEGLGTQLVSAGDAGAIVCTGLFDDTSETPDDYADSLMGFLDRDVPMICANPDIKVQRGDKIIFCAGAIAQLYRKMGGRVSFAGKPYLPIYHMAMARIEHVCGRAVSKDQVLAIGDGVHTDIEGAANADLRSIFVASGVHVDADEGLSAAALSELFPDERTRPIGAMSALEW